VAIPDLRRVRVDAIHRTGVDMRKIVAGAPDGGGSRVVSATTVGAEDGPAIFRSVTGEPIVQLPAIPEEVPPTDVVLVHLWESLGPDLARVGVDSAAEATEFVDVPAPGGLFWRYQVWGPGRPSITPHTSETLDLMFMISGELTLILDEEDVVLRAGDALVLQAASHGWRAGDEGCTTIHLMRRLT